jgi:hypothetical protein
MSGHAAIGIDDDLPPGQTAIAHRPTDHEPSRRVDVVSHFLVFEHFRRNDRFDHLFEHSLADVRQRRARVVLGSNDNGVDACGPLIDVFDGDLRFAIGAQKWQRAILAHFRQAPDDPMRQDDGHGHQFRGLIAGITKHEALIPSPLLGVQTLALRHALVDIRRLLMYGRQHRAGIGVEAKFGVDIAYTPHHIPNDRLKIDGGRGSDLASD